MRTGREGRPQNSMTGQQMRRMEQEWRRQQLRDNLEEIFDLTEGSTRWPAEARWSPRGVEDNILSGRFSFLSAHAHAHEGLEAIDTGDVEAAQSLLNSANFHLINALLSQMTPGQFRDLVDPAKPRGRRPVMGSRNKRLADAVADQETAGLKGKEARYAALKQNPDLGAEFADLSDRTLREAVRAGRKLEGK